MNRLFRVFVRRQIGGNGLRRGGEWAEGVALARDYNSVADFCNLLHDSPT
jgi:hypothetical protein